MTSNIPLNQLQASPSNVRKTGGASIEDLAASIEHHGLLQNIVVVERVGTPYVVAGGRRLLALQLLAKNGKLKDSHPVPCKVVGEAEAAEISLAENTVRQAMHPADEFDAFNALAKDRKLAASEIAARFGTTSKHVEQRLRLANVSQKILTEYRGGKATLEQMMALALVDDHSLQEKVWKASGGNNWSGRPENLRDALVETDVSLDSVLGKFVGLEAYEAAGGKPRRDLFSEFVTLPDSRLVNKLALAKLEEEAAKVRKKGWGWVEVRLSFDYPESAKYKQQAGAKPDAKLGAIVSLERHQPKIQIASGLVQPGQKAPAQAKPKASPGQVKANDRETVEQLRGITDGLLRRHLRQNPHQARAALAATLAASVLNVHTPEPVLGVVPIMAEVFRRGGEIAGLLLADPKGAVALAELSKQLIAGAKAPGGLFAYLNSLDAESLDAIIVELVAAAADSSGNYGERDDAKKFAAAVGLDLAAGWRPTIDWLEKQPRSWVAAQIVAACGKDADKPLAKLKGKEFFDKSLALLQAANWVPEELRPLEQPKPKPVKKAVAKKAARK